MMLRALLLPTVLIFAELVDVCQADAAIDTKQPIRVCGSRLIKLLRAVCQHGIASPKHTGHGAAPQKGIADSCCIHSCTIEHIQSFCREAPPVLMRRSFAERVVHIASQLPHPTHQPQHSLLGHRSVVHRSRQSHVYQLVGGSSSSSKADMKLRHHAAGLKK